MSEGDDKDEDFDLWAADIEKQLKFNRTISLAASGTAVIGLALGLFAMQGIGRIIANLNALRDSINMAMQPPPVAPPPPAATATTVGSNTTGPVVVEPPPNTVSNGYDPGPMEIPPDVAEAVRNDPLPGVIGREPPP